MKIGKKLNFMLPFFGCLSLQEFEKILASSSKNVKLLYGCFILSIIYEFYGPLQFCHCWDFFVSSQNDGQMKGKKGPAVFHVEVTREEE